VAVERLKIHPKLMAPLRHEARKTAEIVFAADPAGAFLDALCDRVAVEPTTEPAQRDPILDVSSPDALPPEPSKRKAPRQRRDMPAVSRQLCDLPVTSTR
jgi:hypothetical protein